MPTLSESAIETLLVPYLSPIPTEILPKLSLYLDILLKWNARTNLTAIRDPEEIVRRHFGESLFAAPRIGPCDTLLDLGSGAGFPGLPIALLHPEIRVTLAESQNKKSTFLREVARTLDLENTEIWPARAESMPPARRFHTVTMRAVDNMAAAITAATPRATHQLLLLTSSPPTLPPEFTAQTPIPIPNSQSTILLRATRT
jgi:16S rRNA (guanine527-N7)-methyltransferase